MVVVPLPAQVDFVFAAWISQGMKSGFGPIAKLVSLRISGKREFISWSSSFFNHLALGET